MPLLLLISLLIAAGCASFDTRTFRAEQAAADTAYASLLAWKQFYRAALTNSAGQTSAQLQACNEQVYAASQLLSATLQLNLRAAQSQSSNLAWLVNTSIAAPDGRALSPKAPSPTH